MRGYVKEETGGIGKSKVIKNFVNSFKELRLEGDVEQKRDLFNLHFKKIILQGNWVVQSVKRLSA